MNLFLNTDICYTCSKSATFDPECTERNIEILQHLAWVIFDFEFVQDSKVARHGVEAWQVVKTTGDKWKILSIVWSSHDAPQ